MDCFKRCSRQEDFLDKFYDRFLSSSDEVREHFRNTSFAVQKQKLRKSLELIAGATEGDPDALRDLLERAETHSRRELNIRPDLYDLWLDALMETIKECDTDFNEEVENACHVILGFAVQYMSDRY